jgi:phosphatidylinositol alpha-mannosyltransferase
MKAADVFCAPSLGGESFGIVIAEAMAAGTPVVCSDLPGYREAAAGAAFEVPAGDHGRTAGAILQVLKDAGKARDMRLRGIARAEELDWEVLSARILECYAAAVNH